MPRVDPTSPRTNVWPRPRARGVLCVATLGLVGLGAPGASATTTLTVDLSAPIRPVTHAASGSLYGVTEMLPADVSKLIAPLRPKMFTNPAANVQQPRGDAIVVAGLLAPTGASVTIRLADWFPGWPYQFTSMSDWFDKLGQTVSRKKAASIDNFYGYEIWNEPNGTWTSSMSFNDFWQQSYEKLRELDPSAKIIGPSLSFYDANAMSSFLTFAKANDCVPDIVSWHELSGGNLVNNFNTYRSLEKQLGIDPLPISINEYSGKDRIDDEGQPGASAPIIAKFERLEVDTACITYWDVAHAGRLGSLLATDTTPNGGWWFYKWYGDMSGTMVTTTPPSPNDGAALDGFANLDASSGTASVLLGGVNDGSIQIVVKGFKSVTTASTVHALIERTPFVNRSTSVSATDTVSTSDPTIANDQVSVTIPGTNGNDGYRLSLSGLVGVGGVAGTAGAGSGGASGSAGTPASGGSLSAGVGGAAGAPIGQGGTPGTGGSGTAAASGTPGAAGLAASGGASSASGGAAGTAGMASGGGAPSDAGRGSGLAGSASGGASMAGASSLTAGSTGMARGGSNGVAGAQSADTSATGCGCRTAPSRSHSGLFAVLGLSLLARRRRTQRTLPV